MNGFYVIEKIGETKNGVSILRCHEQYLESYSISEAKRIMKSKYIGNKNIKNFFIGRWYTEGRDYFKFYSSLDEFLAKNPSAVLA